MEKFVLSSQARDVAVKTSEIRLAKNVPAIVYGHGLAPKAISVNNSEFLKVYRKAGGTHLVELTIDGKVQNVLIHETQRDPVKGDFWHIDFFAVNIKEKIHVQIPVVLVGKSQAVVEGAEVIQNLHSLDVKVLPADLVDRIEVDLAPLVRVGDVIHVADIVANYKKFEILTPKTESIVSASASKEYSDELHTADIADVATVQDAKAAEKSETAKA
jgi:large subunit ribosomal protein L25